MASAWKVPALRRVTDMTADDKDALALLVLSAVLDGYDGARLERHLVQTRLADSAGERGRCVGAWAGGFFADWHARQRPNARRAGVRLLCGLRLSALPATGWMPPSCSA